MKIIGTNITMTRGDSESITLTIKDEQKESHPLSDGDIIYFTVKESVHTKVIKLQKVVDSFEDGKVDKSQVLTNVPKGAIFTDTTYPLATTSKEGLLSSVDKKNIDANTAAKHTHINKGTLDKIVEEDGDLKYNDEVIVTRSKAFTWARLRGGMSWGELVGL